MQTIKDKAFRCQLLFQTVTSEDVCQNIRNVKLMNFVF